jgi:hypothetical protein
MIDINKIKMGEKGVWRGTKSTENMHYDIKDFLKQNPTRKEGDLFTIAYINNKNGNIKLKECNMLFNCKDFDYYIENIFDQKCPFLINDVVAKKNRCDLNTETINNIRESYCSTDTKLFQLEFKHRIGCWYPSDDYELQYRSEAKQKTCRFKIGVVIKTHSTTQRTHVVTAVRWNDTFDTEAIQLDNTECWRMYLDNYCIVKDFIDKVYMDTDSTIYAGNNELFNFQQEAINQIKQNEICYMNIGKQKCGMSTMGVLMHKALEHLYNNEKENNMEMIKMDKPETKLDIEACKLAKEDAIKKQIAVKQALYQCEMERFIEKEKLARAYRKQADDLKLVLNVTDDDMKNLF